jgi:hypothetical protein
MDQHLLSLNTHIKGIFTHRRRRRRRREREKSHLYDGKKKG